MAIGVLFLQVAMTPKNSDQTNSRSSEQASSAQSTQGLAQGPSATTSDLPAFGWSGYAERINGRFAMIGFLAVLLTEALSHDTFLHWAGLVP